jgi:hypothetical protein
MRIVRGAPYLVLILAFLVCNRLTSPSYIGDTTFYAADVVSHAQGTGAPLWEFGHLLWRP